MPLFSETETTITSVRVIGLTRTVPRIAEEPLKRFIGQKANLIDITDVKAVVIDQGILEPISVMIEDADGGSGKMLIVEVREKWSIFPLPIFSAGTGGISFGLFFLNANVFGLNQQMAIGGMYGSDRWFIMGLYLAHPQRPGNFGWDISGSFRSGERRNSDEKDNTIRFFNANSVEARGALHYRISHSLSSALSVSYMNVMLQHTETPILKPNSGAQFMQFGYELSARRSGWDGFFLSEESLSFGYSLFTDVTGSDSHLYHSVSFRGVYQKPLLSGLRLNIRSGGLFRPNAPVFLESDAGVAAVNILPGDFSARYYAGISLGAEQYLYRFSFGTVSLLGTWQMAYSNGPILEDRFDYGVSASLFFYMSRLAIPAMGFGVAYNIPANYFQFSFSIGISF